MFLNRDELKELTGKVRRPSQVCVLQQMGINFKLRPDGYPIILKSHIEKKLDGSAESKNKRKEPDWNALNAENKAS